MNDYSSSLPCDLTELVKFRNRIGSAGIDAIFGASVALHSEACEEERVIIDTTAHEKMLPIPLMGSWQSRLSTAYIRLPNMKEFLFDALTLKRLKDIESHCVFFVIPKRKRKRYRR